MSVSGILPSSLLCDESGADCGADFFADCGADFFVSSHLRILKSAQDNMLLQQTFERIIWLFATLSFQDHN